jgi:hypothetical protein
MTWGVTAVTTVSVLKGMMYCNFRNERDGERRVSAPRMELDGKISGHGFDACKQRQAKTRGNGSSRDAA